MASVLQSAALRSGFFACSALSRTLLWACVMASSQPSSSSASSHLPCSDAAAPCTTITQLPTRTTLINAPSSAVLTSKPHVNTGTCSSLLSAVPYTAVSMGVVSTSADTPTKTNELETLRSEDDLVANTFVDRDSQEKMEEEGEVCHEERTERERVCIADSGNCLISSVVTKLNKQVNEGNPILLQTGNSQADDAHELTKLDGESEREESKDKEALVEAERGSGDISIRVPSSDGHEDEFASLSDQLPLSAIDTVSDEFSLDDLPLALEIMESKALQVDEPTSVTMSPCKKRRRPWRKKRKIEDSALSISESDDMDAASSNENSRTTRKKKQQSQVDETDDSVLKKPIKRPPNSFVAVRVSSSDIHSNIQDMQQAMIAYDPNLSAAMVSTKKLHLTLMVTVLEEENIERGRLALLAAAERASRELSDGLQLQFTGAGHFRNSVVYVRVKEDEGYEQLKTLAGIVRKEFTGSGIELSDDRPFAAHLTVAKLSRTGRNKQRRKIRKIPPESYADFAEAEFGNERVSEIELLSMTEPVDSEGYYHMYDKQPLTRTHKQDTELV